VATAYIVLRFDAGGEGDSRAWLEVGRAEATTDVAAIKAVAKDTGADLSGGAVAVPVRSWRPRKPERKVQEITLWR
jgi:hypothetical protein